MRKATAIPSLDRTIRLEDGRRLAYAEWGDLGGRPVVFIHGSPASRLFCPDEAATKAAGVRLITIDRAGYGRSDPRPGRTLLDWPGDFTALADHLDLPPCPVIGWSAGGRYALVLGVSVPERITTIGVAAAPGPMDLIPNAIDGFDPDEQAAYALLATDRTTGLAAIASLSAWLEDDGWETMFLDGWSTTDEALLADPATFEAMMAQTREGALQGRTGYEEDEVEFLSPWGFDVGDIRRPVHVWVGAADPVVSTAHGRYLADAIPGATLVTFEGEGHLFPIAHWAEMLAAMA
jgi:pimeloyl-ACP methyl ester carboxylesterase